MDTPAVPGRLVEISGWLLRETALGFLRAGLDWVAIASNGHWREPERVFARLFLQEGVETHHITLDPGDDVARRRIRARELADVDGPTLGPEEGLQMLSEVRGRGDRVGALGAADR
jgi:hypothetical protein